MQNVSLSGGGLPVAYMLEIPCRCTLSHDIGVVLEHTCSLAGCYLIDCELKVHHIVCKQLIIYRYCSTTDH